MGVLSRLRSWFRRPAVDRETQRAADAVAEKRDTTRGWYGGASTARPLDTDDRPRR